MLAYCLLTLYGFAQAQQNHTIIILDEHTGLPVEGAHVWLSESSDAQGAVSNASGMVEFILNLPEVMIRVSHISYEDWRGRLISATEEQTVFLTPRQNSLQEVVVTGQTQPVQAHEAVQSIRVIDARHIDEQAAVNLRDLLTNDIGIRLSEDAILGSGMSLQGLSGAKVKILIDGVPLIGRLDGQIDLSQINLNDIERVEIVEGPMSVPYGTDAVAGTLNLITKKKSVARIKGKANAYVETAGRFNFDGSLNIPLGKTQTSLSLGRNFFEGYDPEPGQRDLQWNPKEQYTASLGVQHRFSKLLLRYRTDFFDEEIRNLGNIQLYTVPGDSGNFSHAVAFDDYYFTRRFNHTFSAHYYLKPGIKLRGFVAHNGYRREKNTFRKDLSTGEQRMASGTDLQDTTRFSSLSSRVFFLHDWMPGKLNYQFGYDVNYEENHGQRLLGAYQNITDAALFTIWEYQPFRGLKVEPGLRYAYNSRFEAPLISSLALRYEWDSVWTFRASYGQGFRAPTLKELYFFFVDENHNILGNEDLRAETSHNFQFSVVNRHISAHKSLEVGLSAFYNAIRNEIRLVSVIEPGEEDSRGLFQNVNVARTQTTGGRFSLKGELYSWRFESGVNLIGIRNDLSFSEEALNTDNDAFNFYPQLLLNLHYTWSKPSITASFFLNHTGRRKTLVSNTNNDLVLNTFEPYTLNDFNLKKSFWSDRINLTIGVKNIWDVTQVNSSQTVGGTHSSGGGLLVSYGRTWFSRLQFNF
ncbi:MAG: TonB-dependent receptor plug domain-containing protein [Owenweeksia sp.]